MSMFAPAVKGGRTQFEIPGAAFRFGCLMNWTAKRFSRPKSESRPMPIPFTMLARSGEAISHYYWGLIVHDMAGFKPRKDTLAVTYCHNSGEVIGLAGSPQANDKGLKLSGQLVPMHATDRASEISFKGKSGVPYEASIDFEAIEIEFLEADDTTTVNGQQVTGPAYIVREWTLNGVSICPYGVDGRTWTEFNQQIERQQTRRVTLFSKSQKPRPVSRFAA